MGRRVVPELDDRWVPVESLLHDPPLHALPPAMHQPDFGQAGCYCCADVLGDDRRDIFRGKRVKVKRVLNRDPVGHACW